VHTEVQIEKPGTCRAFLFGSCLSIANQGGVAIICRGRLSLFRSVSYESLFIQENLDLLVLVAAGHSGPV